jgi:hypothetical protein
MTRKNFKAIAAALQDTRPAEDSPCFDQWAFDVCRIMFAIAQFNPRFNASTFERACGGLTRTGKTLPVSVESVPALASSQGDDIIGIT